MGLLWPIESLKESWYLAVDMQCFILAIIVLCIMSWNMWVGIGISIFSIISSMIIKGVQANHYYAQPMAFIHGNWTQGGHGGDVHLDHPFFANRCAHSSILKNYDPNISAIKMFL